MSASGVDDSPIAKRGCSVASINATLQPDLAKIEARIDPAKPAPMMATLTLCFISINTLRQVGLLKI
jgi:hypothetical protein